MKYRIAVSIFAMAALLGADTLTLKNGSIINGRFLGSDGNTVRFSVGGYTNSYDLGDVDSLKFTSHGGPVSNMGTPVPPPPPPAYSSNSNSAYNGPAAPPPYGGPAGPPQNSATPYDAPPPSSATAASNIEIPVGTQIAVRLIDPVDSQYDSAGKTYRASIDRPIQMNGQTIIPRGADAVAVLSSAQQSGKISGKTELAIALRSVTVNGKTYDLATTDVNKTSGSRGAKSGEVIGGGAALGAIIGALAGGGRGAAIGAVSGGALGTGAQVLTHGERVKIPSETVLTFQLQNPLYISNNGY